MLKTAYISWNFAYIQICGPSDAARRSRELETQTGKSTKPLKETLRFDTLNQISGALQIVTLRAQSCTRRCTAAPGQERGPMVKDVFDIDQSFLSRSEHLNRKNIVFCDFSLVKNPKLTTLGYFRIHELETGSIMNNYTFGDVYEIRTRWTRSLYWVKSLP